MFSQDSLLGSSDAELNGVTLSWLCEHMRKYFIIYYVVSSVLLQTRQSFKCRVELRGLFQDYCGDNIMISKRLRVKGGQSLGEFWEKHPHLEAIPVFSQPLEGGEEGGRQRPAKKGRDESP